jgi:hypothetical protein
MGGGKNNRKHLFRHTRNFIETNFNASKICWVKFRSISAWFKILFTDTFLPEEYTKTIFLLVSVLCAEWRPRLHLQPDEGGSHPHRYERVSQLSLSGFACVTAYEGRGLGGGST